jgi:hypothetical protein
MNPTAIQEDDAGAGEPEEGNARMSQASPQRGMRTGTKLTLLVVSLMVIATGWVMWQQLKGSPTRQAGVDLPPYGVVTVQLTTDPFPPLPTGAVQMTLRLQAPGGRMVPLDRVSYTYGPADGEDIFQGEAQPVAMETFQGPLRFTSVGDWWVKVRLEYQGGSGEVQFTVPVKPAL